MNLLRPRLTWILFTSLRNNLSWRDLSSLGWTHWTLRPLIDDPDYLLVAVHDIHSTPSTVVRAPFILDLAHHNSKGRFCIQVEFFNFTSFFNLYFTSYSGSTSTFLLLIFFFLFDSESAPLPGCGLIPAPLTLHYLYAFVLIQSPVCPCTQFELDLLVQSDR